ncbi:peptide chain release factor 2, partial [bacterium]|nr:peptide chain release factor 2 [bacterium]
LRELEKRLFKIEVFLELNKLPKKVKDLEKRTLEVNFWKDKIRARKINQEISNLKEKINSWQRIKNKLNDLIEIAKLDKIDKDVNLRKEIEKEIKEIEKEIEKFEMYTFLNARYDKNNAILSIYAGAGGDDAQDWAEILLRMYLRFCKKRNWETKIIDKSSGQKAGIKSVTIEVEGEYAYGFLKGESGVHRLVRISPFDAEKMRHTSFALVQVLPEIEDVKVEINPSDLRIDTFLASGHGGQYIQKNKTAVRIVHLPTKITVTCQSERSQHQNKERALKILYSKVYQYQQSKKEEEKARLRGEFKSASWGNQIRSYVLHPYKMVKDYRTGYETKDVEKILDGNLNEIIESYLKNPINLKQGN